jgi:hypothetical protein
VLVAPVQTAPVVQQSVAVMQAAADALQHLSLVQAPMRQVAALVQELPDASPHTEIGPSTVHGYPPAHSAAVVHSYPTGTWHWWLVPHVIGIDSATPQQSASVVQLPLPPTSTQHCSSFVVPSGLHVVHGSPPPHCAVAVQVAPGASRLQVPFVQLRPPQQSVLVLHVAPAALQQTPVVQELPLQQSAVVAQVDPALAHVWHEPALQMFEQQSDASVHDVPSPEQLPHAPL